MPLGLKAELPRMNAVAPTVRFFTMTRDLRLTLMGGVPERGEMEQPDLPHPVSQFEN